MAVLDELGGMGVAARETATRTRVSTTSRGDVTVLRPEPRWRQRYQAICLASDFVMALVAGIAAYFVKVGWRIGLTYILLTIALPFVWVGVVALNRAYETRFLGVGSEEFRRVARAGLVLTAVVAFTVYAFDLSVARRYVLVGLPVVTLLTLGERYGVRRWLHHQRARGGYLHRVVVVGHEVPVLEMLRRLGDARHHGLLVVAACLPVPGQRPALMDRGVPVVGGFESVANAVRLTGADTVAVLASPDFGPERLRRLAWDLEPSGADLMVAPSLVEVAGPRLSIRPVTGLPLLQVEQPQFTGGRRIVKLTFDRMVALFCLCLLSPFMVAIALAIRITSSGPALFRQERIGRNGKPFMMIKFRSMVTGAEAMRDELLSQSDRDGLMFKMRSDPRITRIGSWLRRYSLDELPQLLNVLAGSMSLVGPRPPLPEEVERYGDDVRRRLLVLPGVTGLWQVSGRADLSWEESVRLDLRYVDNWTLATDLLILWKTARAVIGGDGAY